MRAGRPDTDGISVALEMDGIGWRIRQSMVIGALMSDMLLNLNPKWIPYSNQVHLYVRHRRNGVESMLSSAGGKHLVFVEYGPGHFFLDEWIYNAANLDQAAIVWARLLDPQANAALAQHFAGRSVWQINADREPLRVSVYHPSEN